MLRTKHRVLKFLCDESDSRDLPDTGLRAWYDSRLAVERKPLVLLVRSRCFVPILKLARNVKALLDRLRATVSSGFIGLELIHKKMINS